jgi:restriction system protein
VAAAGKPTVPKIDVGAMVGTLLHIAWAFWWMWALFLGAWLVKVAIDVHAQRRLSRSGIDQIDAMDGRTFEEYLATLFRRLGYQTSVTQYRGDYGADLVIERDGRRTAVQAKRSTKPVGVKAVQEVVTSMNIYGCNQALVVTNRGFTDQARTLARANGVKLWDRDILVSKLLEAPPATVSEAERCDTCNDVVSEKVLAYCRAHASRFGGRVYCFEHQRSAPQPPPVSAGA